jgi:hypothetical protein
VTGPYYLSRQNRSLGYSYKANLGQRVSTRLEEVDRRLMSRRGQTYLSPCPECDGSGLHKVRCRFYVDRRILQAQSNPNPTVNGRAGWLARAARMPSRQAVWA